MENEEILKKAIEKAGQNGWVDSDGRPWRPSDLQVNIRRDYYRHIFSHDFAKAFWGDKYMSEKLMTQREFYKIEAGLPSAVKQKIALLCCNDVAWQYHLQQMVLEENPIKYLEQFL